MVEFAKSQGDGERDGGFAGCGSAADDEEVFGCRASGFIKQKHQLLPAPAPALQC